MRFQPQKTFHLKSRAVDTLAHVEIFYIHLIKIHTKLVKKREKGQVKMLPNIAHKIKIDDVLSKEFTLHTRNDCTKLNKGHTVCKTIFTVFLFVIKIIQDKKINKFTLPT